MPQGHGRVRHLAPNQAALVGQPVKQRWLFGGVPAQHRAWLAWTALFVDIDDPQIADAVILEADVGDHPSIGGPAGRDDPSVAAAQLGAALAVGGQGTDLLASVRRGLDEDQRANLLDRRRNKVGAAKQSKAPYPTEGLDSHGYSQLGDFLSVAWGHFLWKGQYGHRGCQVPLHSTLPTTSSFGPMGPSS
jgi:hypothetical protein